MGLHRFLFTAVFTGVLFVAGLGCGSDDDEESDASTETEASPGSGEGDGTPTPTGFDGNDGGGAPTLHVSVEDMCGLTVSPTYLPWLEPGEAILESGPVTIEGQSSVQWYEGPEPLSGASVTLLVDVETIAAAGQPLDLFLDGLQTTFGTAPSSGGVLVWEAAREGCGGIALTLDNVPDLSEAEVREELTRIAAGLEPQ